MNKQLFPLDARIYTLGSGIIFFTATRELGAVEKLSRRNYLNDIRDLDNLNKSKQPRECVCEGMYLFIHWLVAFGTACARWRGLKVHRRLNGSVWENSYASSAIGRAGL